MTQVYQDLILNLWQNMIYRDFSILDSNNLVTYGDGTQELLVRIQEVHEVPHEEEVIEEDEENPTDDSSEDDTTTIEPTGREFLISYSENSVLISFKDESLRAAPIVLVKRAYSALNPVTLLTEIKENNLLKDYEGEYYEFIGVIYTDRRSSPLGWIYGKGIQVIFNSDSVKHAQEIVNTLSLPYKQFIDGGTIHSQWEIKGYHEIPLIVYEEGVSNES